MPIIIFDKMKRGYVRYNQLKNVCLVMVLFFFFPSCLVEDRNYCIRYPGVRAVAIAPEGDDPVNEQEVRQVVFYVFDENEKFIDKFTAPLGVRVALNYSDVRSLYVVGLANVDRVNEMVSQFTPEAPLSDGMVTLKQLQSYLSHPVYGSPSDLFLGEVYIANNRLAGMTAELPVARVTAGVNVKIRGLEEFDSPSGEDFSVVVSADYNAFDFYGNPSGNNTNYLPGWLFVSEDPSHHETPIFRIIAQPQGAPVTINIYRGSTLIDVVSADSNGNPLLAYNGKLTEVRISYIGSVKVTVVNSPWGEESIWKDFE